jgi:predicted Rossmann-fold nucleotide-binding protein
MTNTRPVIVCTSYRGVFYGHAADTTGDRIQLQGARMAIYWGTTRGVMELAATGPTEKSKISAPADIEVRGVTAVFEVAPEAEEKWQKA